MLLISQWSLYALLSRMSICSSYHDDPYMLCYSGCLYAPHITMSPMIMPLLSPCYDYALLFRVHICSSYHNDPYMLCYSGYIYAPHITMIPICSAIQDPYMLLISQWSLYALLFRMSICSSYHNDPCMLCYSGCLYAPHITMIPICSAIQDVYMLIINHDSYVLHHWRCPCIFTFLVVSTLKNLWNHPRVGYSCGNVKISTQRALACSLPFRWPCSSYAKCLNSDLVIQMTMFFICEEP